MTNNSAIIKKGAEPQSATTILPSFSSYNSKKEVNLSLLKECPEVLLDLVQGMMLLCEKLSGHR